MDSPFFSSSIISIIRGFLHADPYRLGPYFLIIKARIIPFRSLHRPYFASFVELDYYPVFPVSPGNSPWLNGRKFLLLFYFTILKRLF